MDHLVRRDGVAAPRLQPERLSRLTRRTLGAFSACLASILVASDSLAGVEARPRFEDYPVQPIYSGPKAAPVLRRGSEAWRYRTAIRDAYAATPVNLGGHYVAIYWGCGTPCQQWAIVNAQSGVVFMVPFPTGGGAEFRPDSRLFVADPAQCDETQCEGAGALMQLYRGERTVYYRWDGRQLEAIYPVENPPRPNDAGRQASDTPPAPTRAAEPDGQRPAIVPPRQTEAIIREVQRSHVVGNVPPEGEFDRLLRRDLGAYFCSNQHSDCTVQYEMLRDGPTQSGVAYPKFYVWVRIVGPAAVAREGAVRLAAIAQQRFEVTHFVGRGEIKRDPAQLEMIFPAALLSLIESKAEAGK